MALECRSHPPEEAALQIRDHSSAASVDGAVRQRGHSVCRKARELFLDQPRRGKSGLAGTV